MTGAATGIGAATADLLEERGYAVARNHLPGQRVAGYSAEADVSDPAAVGRMVGDVTRELGPVSVLVANAAHMVMGEIAQVGAGEFWRVVNTNLTGTFACIRACAPGMAERRFGRIVNVASDWGRTGWPRATAYAASKAGVISLTKATALELGPHGITVNAVTPGIVDTPQLQVDADDAGVPLEQILETYAAEVPLGRVAQPRDIAEVIAHLASDVAATITGQIIPVNGGAP
ncbi:MAG TPA: SDR family NAD(P)-dependent oxidoreductase [Gaiellales bacterium]|nr:SDR family NAD(P)-dependent oxidoreductase [Gaiellales bacterium]